MTDHDIHDNTVDDDTLTRLLRTHDVAPADTTALREQLDARLADPTTSFTSPPTPITAAALPRRRLTPVRVGGMVAAAAVAALAEQDMMIVHCYAGTKDTAMFAERYSGCAIEVKSLGGDKTVDMPFDVTYGGTRTVGTAAIADGVATFTKATA